MNKVEKVIVCILCAFVAALSVFCLNHLDLEYISTWGVALLEHIHHGNLSEYAIDLFNVEYGTNYNLFQNSNVALWCLLPYVLSQITNIAVPMLIYQTWIKIIIAILHVLCAWELYKVIKLLGFNQRKAFITSVLYYCSPFVILHGIGIGQIDCLGILFFLISIRLLLEEKYWPMSIAMGIALLSKFFVVFFYVPLFLLNFDKVKKTLKYVGVAVAIPIIDKVVTTLLIRNYSLQADVHNNDSFIPRLFKWSLGYESFVLMLILILCGVCLLLGNRGKRKDYYYLLFPSVFFYVFLLLVFWHPQWFLYIFPVILIMGCYVANEFEYAFFYSGLVLGFTLHSLVNCNIIYFNAMLTSKSLFGYFVPREDGYIGTWILSNVSKYAGNIGYTIFMAAFALLILLYYMNVYKKQSIEKEIKVPSVLWYGIAVLPVLAYIGLILITYI